MKRVELADRISVITIAMIALFLVTVTGTLLWMATQFNSRATHDTVKMVTAGINDLQRQTEVVAIDYSLWDAAYDGMQDQDEAWIYDNFASGATAGDAFQILALTDGPFEQTQSWIAGGPEEPRPDLLPRRIIGEMRARVADIRLGEMKAAHFFARIDDHVYALAGTRVAPWDEARLRATDPATFPLAVFGSRIGEDVFSKFTQRYLIDNVHLQAERPEGAPGIPLRGADGQPVAYLSWAPSTPGNTLLRQVIWPLLAVFAVFTLFAATVANKARASADRLIAEETRTWQAARTNTLTGLPNRLALSERLREVERSEHSELAIVLMDLNGLKAVNDTVGHSGGDVLMRRLTERLRKLDPAPDHLACLGGDEFALLTEGSGALRRAEAVAQAIREALVPDFHIADRKFRMTAAIGIASRNDIDVTPAELLRRADLAMIHAKRKGTTEPTRYDPAIESGVAERKIIEETLREALARPEEFSVHYQPIVDARTGEMVKAECLARWTSAKLGRVEPEVFVSVAEEAGLIIEFGRLIISMICQDLQIWPGLHVSVNISPAQIADGNFTSQVLRKLAAAKISPSRIEIELTESLIVGNIEMAAFKLDRLSEAGFSTSLDDFGTGFSSIGYLQRMPFDTLKIDKSFVTALPDDENALKMIEGIVMVGKSLGQTIVCEGVETEAQAAVLRGVGCNQLQGYHFAQPMPFEELMRHPLAAGVGDPPLRSAG